MNIAVHGFKSLARLCIFFFSEIQERLTLQYTSSDPEDQLDCYGFG